MDLADGSSSSNSPLLCRAPGVLSHCTPCSYFPVTLAHTNNKEHHHAMDIYGNVAVMTKYV